MTEIAWADFRVPTKAYILVLVPKILKERNI